MSSITLRKTNPAQIISPLGDDITLFATDNDEIGIKKPNGNSIIIGNKLNDVLSVEIIMDRATYTNLVGNNIKLTEVDLGIVNGQAAIFEQDKTLVTVDPDGVDIIVTDNIIIQNNYVQVIGTVGAEIFKEKTIKSIKSAVNETAMSFAKIVTENHAIKILITSTDIIGGSASSTITIKLFYKLLDL